MLIRIKLLKDEKNKVFTGINQHSLEELLTICLRQVNDQEFQRCQTISTQPRQEEDEIWSLVFQLDMIVMKISCKPQQSSLKEMVSMLKQIYLNYANLRCKSWNYGGMSSLQCHLIYRQSNLIVEYLKSVSGVYKMMSYQTKMLSGQNGKGNKQYNEQQVGVIQGVMKKCTIF